MNISEEILGIADILSKKFKEIDSADLERLIEVAKEVGKSWSGSWLGYHSRVYYKGFKPIPPGARFSSEWGLAARETIGEWEEHDFDNVVNAIHKNAGNPDLSEYEQTVKDAVDCFEGSQSRLLSILSTELDSRPGDKFLEGLIDKIGGEKVFTASDFVDYFAPSGQLMSRDANAIQAGPKTPPHISVIARTNAIIHPFDSCEKLSKYARQASSHIENPDRIIRKAPLIGTNVFIGHGHSNVWKDLKDFIQDRLKLTWDEFNRIPVAGVTNITRLSKMLDDAAIAFLIMTGEDEHVDGEVHARENVIHEVGLFQGRLGFERAIVLLEEGCQEFTNILGLGQIRFPKNNISAIFEDIRRVLEREGLIER